LFYLSPTNGGSREALDLERVCEGDTLKISDLAGTKPGHSWQAVENRPMPELSTFRVLKKGAWGPASPRAESPRGALIRIRARVLTS
jgi:hypothetical protein